EYSATFDIVDSDDDGRISAVELMALMALLGDEVDEEQAGKVVAQMDEDGDSLITLEEFAEFMREHAG
ncbi:MAG: EF-hand domain-containing protein, partial [Streptosporangiales bacterium]|nr:EF-hand domain-containing protein [Streptosporangiales bacterium]